MSEAPLLHEGRELRARAELVGACSTVAEAFPNLLATAAFFVVNSGYLAAPGVILPDVLAIYPYLSSTMEHLLLLPPFLWEGRLETLQGAEHPVAWLLASPISEAERLYTEEHGVSALEMVFERQQIDVFDLNRPSAL